MFLNDIGHEICWLSCHKELKRFVVLREEIVLFLNMKGEPVEHFYTDEWVQDLAFAIDLTGHLQDLNLKLQNDNQNEEKLKCNKNFGIHECDASKCHLNNPVENETLEYCPDSNKEEMSEFSGSLTLDQLDDDVLFHIATFLEARVVKYALSQVCKRFQEMFDNEMYWKMRMTVRFSKKYPAVPCPPNFQWDDACVAREDMHRVWSNIDQSTHNFMYSCNIYGGVDAVHLMQGGEILVAGDRNRSLNLIDLTKYPGNQASEKQIKEMLVHSNKTAHEGWIWSITSVDKKVITGCWDNQIRMFDAEVGCSLASSFKCKAPVLSLYAEDNEIVASCFDKKVYFIDRRTSAVRSRVFHTKPVLCVTGSDHFIISGSEDKSISIFERRAGKIFMMFKLDKYPLCLSYSDNQLWFGDVSGNLHLHDGTEDVFQYIGTYNVGHTEKMTGLITTPGAIFTCSGDKSIKVLDPTREPTVIASINVHKKEIAKIDYKNGVLVSAGGEDCIGVWLSKSFQKESYVLV